MAAYGVHSEVGKLRKVIVHRPDLSLQRLTPATTTSSSSTTCSGGAGPTRTRRVRPGAARAGGRSTTPHDCSPKHGRQRRSPSQVDRGGCRPHTVGCPCDEVRDYLSALDLRR